MSESGSSDSTIKSWIPPSIEELQALIPEYEIEAILGRGGMGAVYKGRQVSLGRDVAIKLLPATLIAAADASDDDRYHYVERFKREARAMANLHHPAIVALWKYGETAVGHLYFVMEYIGGMDIEQYISACGGTVDPEHALAIVAHVLDALEYAHDRGIVHRDIKPANVLIDQAGHVKLADFGLVKEFVDGDDAEMSSMEGLTRPDLAMGTPNYMAPEIFDVDIESDHRADLYAVGVMLYKMLTGKLPRGIFKLPSDVNPALDPRFDGLVAQGMAAHPEDRFQSASVFRSALGKMLSEPVRKVEPGQDSNTVEAVASLSRLNLSKNSAGSESSRKRFVALVNTGVVVLCLVVVASVFVFLNGRDRDGSEPEREDLATLLGVESEPIEPATVTAAVTAVVPGFEGTTAGEVKVIGGIEFAWCPAGTFTMGSPEDEEGRYADEDQVKVTLSKGFWMARTECTQAQWKSVMGDNPSAFEGEDLPVDRVSWEVIQKWLTKMNADHSLPDGWKWALPSEAQWEYACRAGTKTVFAFGNSLSSEQANFYEADSDGEAAKGPLTKPPTSKVGTYPANNWGLYDMHGNIFEFCADWYSQQLSGGTDPQGSQYGSERVLRGGAFSTRARLCRSASRYRLSPSKRWNIYGFRVAISSTAKSNQDDLDLPSREAVRAEGEASAISTLSIDGVEYLSVRGERIEFQLLNRDYPETMVAQLVADLDAIVLLAEKISGTPAVGEVGGHVVIREDPNLKGHYGVAQKSQVGLIRLSGHWIDEYLGTYAVGRQLVQSLVRRSLWGIWEQSRPFFGEGNELMFEKIGLGVVRVLGLHAVRELNLQTHVYYRYPRPLIRWQKSLNTYRAAEETDWVSTDDVFTLEHDGRNYYFADMLSGQIVELMGDNLDEPFLRRLFAEGMAGLPKPEGNQEVFENVFLMLCRTAQADLKEPLVDELGWPIRADVQRLGAEAAVR